MTSGQGTTEVNQPPQPLTGRVLASGLLAIAVLVALDQGVKHFITGWLGPDADRHRWELAGRYLAFQYVENEGAAFGILAGQTGLLTVLAIGVAVWFVLALRRDLAVSRALQLAMVLILAGAIGNLTDRVRLGYVVDFVAVGTWPKFNLADAGITVALVIMGWTLLQPAPVEQRPAVPPAQPTNHAEGEGQPAREESAIDDHQ